MTNYEIHVPETKTDAPVRVTFTRKMKAALDTATGYFQRCAAEEVVDGRQFALVVEEVTSHEQSVRAILADRAGDGRTIHAYEDIKVGASNTRLALKQARRDAIKQHLEAALKPDAEGMAQKVAEFSKRRDDADDRRADTLVADIANLEAAEAMWADLIEKMKAADEVRVALVEAKAGRATQIRWDLDVEGVERKAKTTSSQLAKLRAVQARLAARGMKPAGFAARKMAASS